MSQLSLASFDRQKLKGPVYWLFNDDLMTVLAVILVPAIGLPMLFQLSPVMLALLDLVNYFVIAMFIAEYLLKLYVADSRLDFARDPWHALDLLIVLLALVDFFGLFSGGRASPILRLLRLLRIFTAAGRGVKIHRPPTPVIKALPTVSRMIVNTMDRHGIDRCTGNGQPCKIIDDTAIAWIDMQDVSPIDLDYISRSINVPRIVIESKIVEEAFPRIDYYSDYTTIFLWDAKLVSRGEGMRDMGISRTGLLIVCEGNRIITICTGRSRLFDEISGEGLAADSVVFPAQVLYSILRHKVKDGEEIVRAFEQKTVMLEELPVEKTPPAFLADTFHLKKEVQKINKNLWHLRQVLDNLKTRKVALNGITDEHLHLFDILYDEVDYLYETSQNINDSMASLRELHINTNSYELTRVMRILAIITCMALVPSTIGGLLGENILGQPFPLTIGEVMVIVASLMVLELYAFYKMGWLR
jgi:Mg2+ and Co2+ transporter CorA